MARRIGRLSSGALVLEHSNVALQAIVQEIDYHPDARRMADTLVRQQPHRPAVIGAGRDASDKVRLGVGYHTRKDSYSEAGPDCG